MRPKIGSHFDSGLEKPPPPPFWTSPESFRGKLNEAFPNTYSVVCRDHEYHVIMIIMIKHKLSSYKIPLTAPAQALTLLILVL